MYGYRRLSLQWCDLQQRFSLTLLCDYQAANLPEWPFATAQLLQLPGCYPTLQVGWVAGDAAFGWDPFLMVVRNPLRARWVVDLRVHDCDQDQTGWLLRGYADRGRPLCPFDYGLKAIGYDPQQRRQKWICAKACQKGLPPRVAVPQTVYPSPECPYQQELSDHSWCSTSVSALRMAPCACCAICPWAARPGNAITTRGATLLKPATPANKPWV